MSFSDKHIMCPDSRGQHRMVYSDWGPEDGTPLVCVHGLTGNGHDFDFLAEELIKDGHRLICVDLPGRGRSDFLSDPRDYNHKQYMDDLGALLKHLGLTTPNSVDWLGVSLGGFLGMRFAAMENSPVRRLILNDIGPVVPQAALDFIYQVISQTYTFDTIRGLEKRMRETRGLSWGPMTDAHWHHMAEHNARALEDGSITYAYDPAIAKVFEHEPIGEVDLWSSWDAITCPVMLIWGARSLILTKEIIEQMSPRGPGPDMHLTILKDCGHVPSLWAPDQIKAIRQWLKKTQI